MKSRTSPFLRYLNTLQKTINEKERAALKRFTDSQLKLTQIRLQGNLAKQVFQYFASDIPEQKTKTLEDTSEKILGESNQQQKH